MHSTSSFGSTQNTEPKARRYHIHTVHGTKKDAQRYLTKV